MPSNSHSRRSKGTAANPDPGPSLEDKKKKNARWTALLTMLSPEPQLCWCVVPLDVVCASARPDALQRTRQAPLPPTMAVKAITTKFCRRCP